MNPQIAEFLEEKHWTGAMPFCILRSMKLSTTTKTALLAVAGVALVVASATPRAEAAEVLAAPRLVVAPAAQRSVTVLSLFVVPGILDLRGVQADPVMRARLEYSLMTALPVVEQTHATPLPILGETKTWKLSRTVLLTFPLAITGRNLVTAEISGTGQLAVMPTGLANGGVFTFTGAF